MKGIFKSMEIDVGDSFVTVVWHVDKNKYDGNKLHTTHFDQESIPWHGSSWRIECHLLKIKHGDPEQPEVGKSPDRPPYIWTTTSSRQQFLHWKVDMDGGLYMLPSDKWGRFDKCDWVTFVEFRPGIGGEIRANRRIQFQIWKE